MTSELTTREWTRPILLRTAGDSDAAKIRRGEAYAERRSTTVEKDNEKKDIVDNNKIMTPRQE